MEERLIVDYYMVMKKILMLCTLLLTFGSIFAQEDVERRTLHFATADGQELMLDYYRSAACGDSAPCMIFAFGGGFVGGDRAWEHYMHYFEELARNGISVASIDYRLGLKGLSGRIGVLGMIDIMKHSVDIAVEDMYAATRYIIDNAEQLGVDVSKIMLSGSSAGAITALQAEWGRSEGLDAAKVLPEDFRYAGVVACAGALFSKSGKPKFRNCPAPMLLFHGTSDCNVPYNKASIMGIGFYGSQYIVKQLDKLQSPYLFCSMEYADHSVAVTPLIEQTDLILQFINDYVVEGNRLCVKCSMRNLETEPRPTHFTARKYLKTNYAK